MAGAMIKGLLSSGVSAAENIYCLCGPDDSGKKLSADTGIHFRESLSDVPVDIDCIVLACKPQQLAELPASLSKFSSDKLVLSILAGITLQKLSSIAGEARAIVRVMPNTPAQIGKGISAYATSVTLSKEDALTTRKILSAMGDYLQVSEDKMDIVTALSGSGPAYLFELTHALSVAGSALGLDRNVADKLARQTMIGAAALMEARQDASPEALRQEVTSPGGTTEAALTKLSQNDHRGIWRAALQAAKERSRELSQGG